MAKKGVNARRSKRDASAGRGASGGTREGGSSGGIGWRLTWIGAAGLWVFLVLALASFDAADAPSHVVAVHNDPPTNLCGRAGAVVAYGAYLVPGAAGSWALLAAAGAYLVLRAAGRTITHPVVRLVGAGIVSGTLAGMHGLLFPTLGPLAGAHAGLVGQTLAVELAARFNTVGTFLLLLAALLIGAVVVADTLVFALPWALLALLRKVRSIPLPDLRALRLRPETAIATAGRGSAATGRAATTSSRKRSSSSSSSVDGAIDPDAGGLGGVESFDPDAYEVDGDDDEQQWEYEDADDDGYEYEYEDDDEDGAEADEADATPRRQLTAEELRAKIAKLPVRMGAKTTTVARDEDIPRQENFEGYQFPTLDLLEDPESDFSEEIEQIVRRQAEQLEEALQTFSIDGEVKEIESGPTVTLYRVELAPGTKVAKVNAVASDIARALRAQNIRVVPNIAGTTAIGIEVPNLKKEKVRLKELMSSGHADGMHLPMFLGKDAAGEPLVADLARMPHMLIAGTTGSGKSVCMNTIIMSWLYTKRPDELKMILVDPKMVELSQFADIPHLMCPVVTEMGRAAAILEWAVNKMEERYELLKEARVRDIDSYNELTEEELYEIFDPQSEEEKAKIPKRLPFIVFVIDELADLMLMHKEVEQFIVRIAQKARAVGIHLILATQRPQANVVTGLIKSNMPCRVSFKVSSGMDSRIVLDQKGAELLLGQGDMMFLSPHTLSVKRSQGTLVSDREIRKVTKFLKEVAAPTFERSLIAIRPAGAENDDMEGLDATERDPLFDKAVEVMIESGRGSVSLLQRRLAIGYSRASRLVDQMGLAGILGEHRGSVARDVLITMEDWQAMKELEAAEAAEDTLWQDGGDADAEAEADADADGEAADEYEDVEAEDEGEWEEGDEEEDDGEWEDGEWEDGEWEDEEAEDDEVAAEAGDER